MKSANERQPSFEAFSRADLIVELWTGVLTMIAVEALEFIGSGRKFNVNLAHLVKSFLFGCLEKYTLHHEHGFIGLGRRARVQSL